MKMRWLSGYIVLAALLVVMTVSAQADTIGYAEIPAWEPEAQTKLGWVFTYDPFTATVVSGWDRVVGGVIPEWTYIPPNSPAATWYIEVPNVNQRNPVKRLWLSIVYDHIVGITGERIQTGIDGDFTEGYLVGPGVDPVGPLEVIYSGQTGDLAQITYEYLLFPNPSWESIGISLTSLLNTDGSYTHPHVREVYILAECVVPEPATVSLLGLGLAGMAMLRVRRKAQD